MLRITVTGIVAATFFGTILGIARLSNNYIVEKTATSLLEVVRNVPLLVQILFFQALILSLPRLEVYDVGSVLFHASSKGVALSWPNRQDGAWMFMLYFLITLYISNRVYKQRVKLLEEQGRETKPFLWSLSTLVILFAIGIFQSSVITIFWFLSGPTDIKVIGISINSSIAFIYFLAFSGKSSNFLTEVMSSVQPSRISYRSAD